MGYLPGPVSESEIRECVYFQVPVLGWTLSLSYDMQSVRVRL